jgi:hypothetical protein
MNHKCILQTYYVLNMLREICIPRQFLSVFMERNK